ncbi:XrtA/PEP-CTERM system TPR-repeat protein PrsT [Hahella ganghwensis]|uniref:XrtA/PEP-CTERM system TPR-repeat protein PrsT n=1 Tax=Hahella ganghwensis TaxID=286420 RepID=UPI000360391A|nr:XrtA/PEP-CTERM system TPR-repeat protein PrsT [Hahella ganghwensis]
MQHLNTLSVTFTLLLVLFSHAVVADEVVDNYELATKAFNEKKSNEAFIYLKNALQKNPDHLPSKILLSKVYLDAGNMEAAELELNDALGLGADINLLLPMLGSALVLQEKADDVLNLEKFNSRLTKPNQFELALLKGQAYLIKEDETLAQMQFEQALKILPNSIRGMNTLATLYLKIGWLDKADLMIKQSLDIDSDNEKTLVLSGDLAARQGNLEAALDSYLAAFDQDNDDPRILRSLVSIYLKMNNREEVKRYINLILTQSPNDPAATLINAWLLIEDNDYDVAQQSLADLTAQLSLLDDPELAQDASLLFIQGASEFIQGNLEKAKKQLELYLSREPSNLAALRMLTEVYVKSGNARKARELLESRRHDIVADAGLQFRLVQLYINEGKMLSADQLLDTLEARYPNSSFIIYLKALIEKGRKRPQQALDLLNSVTFKEAEPLSFALLRGELLMQLNRLDEARAIADDFVERQAERIDVLNYIAAVYLRSEQVDTAMTFIEKVLAKDSADLNALFNKAIALKSKGQTEEAQKLLSSILEINDQHTPSYLLLARIEMQEGKLENALSRANKVLVYNAANPQALETKLAIYKQQQNWVEALETVRQLNKLDRLNTSYLVELVNVLTRLGRQSETERYFKILQSIWSEDADNLGYLARLQMSAGQPDAALESMEKAVQLAPKSLEMQLGLSRLHFSIGQLDKAEEMADRMESQFGRQTEVIVLKGDLAQARGSLESARAAYYEALKSSPDSPPILFNLYQLTLSNVGEEQFASMMESKVNSDGALPWMRKLLADSYLNRGMLEEARKHYEKLRAVPGLENDPAILNNLANIYADSDLAKALDMALKGLDQDAKNPALLDTVGWILARQEKYKEALPYLRNAYSVDASSGEIRYHLGYTLLKLDRSREALVELEAAVAAGDSYADYAEAKALLESQK